jgi:hypothetical protein
MSDEIIRQAKHAGEKKSADLCRGLAHAALEGCVFLNDKNPQGWVAPLQKKRGRGSGQGAADDDHIELITRISVPVHVGRKYACVWYLAKLHRGGGRFSANELNSY